MFKLFRKKLAIGIDISDYSVEVLRLSKSGEVLAYGRVILEEGVVQDGKILKKEQLAKKLKELFLNTKPRPLDPSHAHLYAVVSLPESKTFIHYLELPLSLRGDELKRRIYEEASKIVPYDTQNIYWDYTAIPDKESRRVLFVGAPKEITDEYVEIIRLAGLEPVVLDVESASLGRSLVKPLSLEASSMVLDIGSRTTNLDIFDSKGLLHLSVTIPVAGSHFTKAIAEELKIGNDEAEKMKRSLGLDDKKKDNKVFSILRESFQKIIKEINAAISYYEEQSGEKIQEIILAGGSALLPKVDEYLAVNLEKKVTIGDPLKQIKGGQVLGRENHPILFANVIGLALRGAGDISAGINLLQKVTGAKKAKVQKMPRISKLQTVTPFQRIKNSRIFAASFIIVGFAVLGVVMYKYIFVPSAQDTRIGEVSQEQPTLDESKVEPPIGETPVATTTTTKEESVAEDNTTIEKITEVIIQDTPTGWLNVREGPGTSYNRIDRVYPKETYTLLEEDKNWYKIKIDEETEGWVTSQYATKE